MPASAPAAVGEESARLAEELLKATGAVPKTVGDRVADTLETLHLKTKPEAKAAAERVAESLPHLSAEESNTLASGLTGKGPAVGASGPIDSVLKVSSAPHLPPYPLVFTDSHS